MDFSENALDTVDDNDKSENHENVILGEYYEIKLGMQVSSEEEAYTCSFNILFTVQLQLSNTSALLFRQIYTILELLQFCNTRHNPLMLIQSFNLHIICSCTCYCTV